MLKNQTLIDAGIKGGSAQKHRWTEEERNIVRRDYAHNRESAKKIAMYLGVTEFAVKGQVSIIGLGNHDNRHPWTPKEDEKLRRLLRRWGPRTVAVKMHRSLNSVVLRSKRINIKRRTRDGWFTKADVCAILGVDHHWVEARIATDALKARWHDSTAPQKGGSAAWHIEESDLKKFIQQYPQELAARNLDIIMVVDILAGVINNY